MAEDYQIEEESVHEDEPISIMDFEELKQLILMKNGKRIQDDDAEATIFTIHQYFLEKFTQEQSRLFGVQLQSFVDALSNGSSQLEKGVNTALRSLQDEVLNGYVRDNLAKITEQTKLVDKQASISSEIVKQFRTHRKTLVIITAANIGGMLLTILLWLSIWLS